MKKIAVPLAAGAFSSHFGGADAFALFTAEGPGAEIASAAIVAAPAHEHGSFPRWLRDQEVTAILAGGMGQRASAILTAWGIEVVLGVEGGDPEVLARAYLAGRLTSSGSLCGGGGLHACGDHDHEHGHHHEHRQQHGHGHGQGHSR
ncbi:MAG TPA: NifB/NifX family molybdenum-iron cluster-binding protein [Thermoanaerobaculia bacterium]|nr:NifB/NifX family molybdenum-iron cluster-binding protein [Thermoanaerobaculia bacterium]